ncbi:hypothetical protein DAPPUDRAFT_65174, partial [Daphnia pulex]
MGGLVGSEHHSPSPTTLCGGCGFKITDRYYLVAVERAWHSECLRCGECRRPLDTALSCFSRQSRIYCRDDYYRLFGVRRCNRCCLPLGSNELVMRARDAVFHLACFTCAACNQPLAKGDIFGMRDGIVYCRLHYEMLQHPSTLTFFPSLSSSGGLSNGGLGGNSPGSGSLGHHHSVQKGRPRKRKIPPAAAAGMVYDSSGTNGSASGGGGGGGSSSQQQQQQQRTKRMRTSFKHHQLRTMKSYFAINQNPDAKDLKQLAQKTGLSKRVLQVWFQNARAKWRRNIMRQQDGG